MLLIISFAISTKLIMPACGREQSVSALWATTPRSPSPTVTRIKSTKMKTPQTEPMPETNLSFLQLFIALCHLIWLQFTAIPTIWLCIYLWIFSKIFTILEWLSVRRKRTIIVSGGGTVQGLELARTLYCKGIRVVMVENEGTFSISRFSSAVARSYTVPRPSTNIHGYIQALCDIVTNEGATTYIPVSASNEAIYDALAKPHLEQLQCSVICPRSSEVRHLDDFLDVLERCRHLGLPTPLYYPVYSLEDVYRLYDSGLLRSARHFMTAAGSNGVRKRNKIPLPPFCQDFRPAGEISAQSPWVVVQELQGEQLVACCTIREGLVVGSVVCKQTSDGMETVSKSQVIRWLEQTIRALRLGNISAHLTLDIVITGSGVVVPLGIRVGVPTAYVCHTTARPPLLSKPCPHVCIEPEGSIVQERDVTFAWWDPLPYCVYNYLLLPAHLLKIDYILGVKEG